MDPILIFNNLLRYDLSLPGPTGSTGLEGERGPTGPLGMKGLDGPKGPIGPKGEDGKISLSINTIDNTIIFNGIPINNLPNFIIINYTGDSGPTGPTGDSGPSGPTGDSGPQGIQGIQGKIGIKGDNGVTGPEGPTGLGFTNDIQSIEGVKKFDKGISINSNIEEKLIYVGTTGMTTVNNISLYSFTIPEDVYEITLKLWGSGGVSRQGISNGGGAGGYVLMNAKVKPGHTLYIIPGTKSNKIAKGGTTLKKDGIIMTGGSASLVYLYDGMGYHLLAVAGGGGGGVLGAGGGSYGRNGFSYDEIYSGYPGIDGVGGNIADVPPNTERYGTGAEKGGNMKNYSSSFPPPDLGNGGKGDDSDGKSNEYINGAGAGGGGGGGGYGGGGGGVFVRTPSYVPGLYNYYDCGGGGGGNYVNRRFLASSNYTLSNSNFSSGDIDFSQSYGGNFQDGRIVLITKTIRSKLLAMSSFAENEIKGEYGYAYNLTSFNKLGDILLRARRIGNTVNITVPSFLNGFQPSSPFYMYVRTVPPNYSPTYNVERYIRFYSNGSCINSIATLTYDGIIFFASNPTGLGPDDIGDKYNAVIGNYGIKTGFTLSFNILA